MGSGSTVTVPISYCGGSNYRDLTKHNMVLRSNGYYICSTCGYRVKSPDLEDITILSHNDYLQVEAIKRSRLVYLMDDYTSIAEALLRTIDNIRSRPQYKYSYNYADSSGCYVSPYKYKENIYDLQVSIGANYILQSNLAVTTNCLAMIVVKLGTTLPYPYGLIFTVMDWGFEGQIEMNFTDAISTAAEEIDKEWGNLFKICTITNEIISQYNKSASFIGDVLITVRITCPEFERTSRLTFEDSDQIIITSESHEDGANPYDYYYKLT